MSELEKKLEQVADEIIKIYSPCKIQDGKCLGGNPTDCCRKYPEPGCTTCIFLKNGCTKPNLDCKIWFCETALKNMPIEFREAVYSLENIAKQFNLTTHPFLGEPYVGADKP